MHSPRLWLFYWLITENYVWNVNLVRGEHVFKSTTCGRIIFRFTHRGLILSEQRQQLWNHSVSWQRLWEKEQTRAAVLSVLSAATLLTVTKKVAEGRPDLITELQVLSKNYLAACRVEFKSTWYNKAAGKFIKSQQFLMLRCIVCH